MGHPEDPGQPTEPMPPSGERRSTQPLPAETPRSRTAPEAGDRRLWLVAGGLALILAFVAGYLVGRGAGEEPVTGPAKEQANGQGPIKKQVCVQAVRANQKAVAIQERAVASLGALVKATAEGDDSLMAALNAELEGLSERFDRVSTRANRLSERCGA
jgi:hypothetical protein